MLNERQKAFCEHYAACLNATEAAKRSGYSEKTAYSSGNRMLKNVEVIDYIDFLLKNEKEKRIATMDDVFKFLSDTMQNASERTNDRLKAASLLSELLTAGSESDSDTIKVVVEKKVVDLSGGSEENARD